MAGLKLHISFLLLMLSVQGYSRSIEDISKFDSQHSVGIVIDDTDSMSDEIPMIVENLMYNGFISIRNTSFIDNFVLVTFNDPEARLRALTKDRDVLYNAIKEIKADGGGEDCAEYAMTGIKLAIENCLPRSHIYVFTDASAADYQMYKEVKDLALEKENKIFIILTGHCGNDQYPEFQVYYKLGNATNGGAFKAYF